MENLEIRAYLSESERMEGKETMGCIAFHEDLGILDPATFCLVAARGLYLKVGDPVALSHEEQEFLEGNKNRKLYKGRNNICLGDDKYVVLGLSILIRSPGK